MQLKRRLRLFPSEKIMRDVNSGWLLRYMHANGASFFFIAVYLHVRGLYAVLTGASVKLFGFSAWSSSC